MKIPIDLDIWQLSIAYFFALFLTIMIKIKGGLKTLSLMIACFRMTIQLVLAAYVLRFLLKNPSPFFSVLVLLAMQLFASYTIIKKAGIKANKHFSLLIIFSIITGSLACISFFFFFVLRVPMLSNPQYFIPIAGMLVGNSMTALSLAARQVVEKVKTEKDVLELALMLGANSKDALKKITDEAFESAILPTLNSMLGTGIVFLPGLMTGQILSGISPIIAIKYQIAIMLGILGSTALSSFIFLQVCYKIFFNKDSQIVEI